MLIVEVNGEFVGFVSVECFVDLVCGVLFDCLYVYFVYYGGGMGKCMIEVVCVWVWLIGVDKVYL